MALMQRSFYAIVQHQKGAENKKATLIILE